MLLSRLLLCSTRSDNYDGLGWHNDLLLTKKYVADDIQRKHNRRVSYHILASFICVIDAGTSIQISPSPFFLWSKISTTESIDK